MSRRLNFVLGTALALALANGEALAQTRPTGAIGYSAAERRVVDQRLANLAEQIERLSSQRVMSPRLVRAIATEVGLANPRFSDAELLTAVEAMSELAEQLRADNAQMRGELVRLRDPTLRDPALALLDQAEAALNEGRLADAEALFGEIRNLRWDESRAAGEAWSSAVKSEARTAELRQDFIGAQDERIAASDRLLARAKADHQLAFELVDAAAQGRLREGEIFGRSEALDAAIALWQKRVLPLVPRDSYPEFWAWAQDHLGLALSLQGERSGGAAGLNLLSRAVSAHEAALEVRTRADMPAEWAMTQNNLGNSLQRKGERSGGEAGLDLLARAVGAYEAALEVHTREEVPSLWATAQNNLGVALSLQGERSSGPAGLNQLSRAVSAHEAALEVRTRADMPTEWAMTQNNLCLALSLQGGRSGGEAGLGILASAVSACEAALRVYTRAEMPYLWAIAQDNLALAEEIRGDLSDGAAQRALWRSAEAAVLQALEVYDPDNMGHYHEKATTLLTRIRAKLAAAE